MIMGMGGGSLSEEIFECFDYAEYTVTVSAFVQQRTKIKHESLNLFQNNN